MTSPTLDRVLDAVLRVDTSMNIQFISEAGQRWLTRMPGTQLPKNFFDMLHVDDVASFRRTLAQAPESFTCDLRLTHSGAECWINLRSYQLAPVSQYVFCVVDISMWKSEDSALRHAALHDELTGLPNRAALKQMVEQQIAEGKPVFSIALLDLDGFKKVNDTYGHAMGDAVLVETTKRLQKVMLPGDTITRLGGDEFVMLFEEQECAGCPSRL